MDGSDAAAAEALRAQQELGAAVEGAARYVRLVLARHVADEAIRRFSDAHQDPLLQRARSYLKQLTNGSCVKVGVEDDAKNGPRLSATKPDGGELSIAELSDGTRDQLYFGLRLAAIEQAVTRTGQLPIVLDDILVNFDDDRARIALSCLVTLAAGAQVLFFTHHRHVVQLAEEELAADDFTIHELEPL